jgi:hypothetical protein
MITGHRIMVHAALRFRGATQNVRGGRMKMTKQSTMVWLGTAVLSLVLAACGSGGVTGSGVTGVALSDSPIQGTVSLTDSSPTTQLRQVSTRSDGSFSIDVEGLAAPYMLKVEGTDQAGPATVYAVSVGNENLDVNPLTDVAFRVVAAGSDEEQVFQTSTSDDRRRASTTMQTLLAQLSTVLAPLFERYGITNPLTDKAAVRLLLADVRIEKDDGWVKVTNRATAAVIFKGPLNDLASGTFYPENMPPGPGTTTSTCTSFTYSAWSDCQSSNTQTRTVLTSSPTGCTGGAPVTSQSCTYVPPPPPPPATCTGFTYSTWGACQADGTQTRTVIASSPTGCTGGAPVTSQSCTYVPPPTTCTSFTYSAWNACQANNTQTRTVLTSSPTGCTGGAPVTTQACTYDPPFCSSFTYSAWGACQPGNTQTRTVLSSMPIGCAGGSPVTTQACTYAAPNPVTSANVVSSCTGCHGLTSNTTVFKSGGYTVTGRSASQWLSTVSSMVSKGASLAPGTTAQNYADYLANAP